MTCDERRDAILLWAMGALDDAEVLPLREHLASGCARCEAALAGARELQLGLLMAPDPSEPSPGLERRLLARIAAQGPTPSGAAPPWRWAAAAGLSILLAGALGYDLATSDAPRDADPSELAASRAALEESRTALEESEEALEESYAELGELEHQVAELETQLEETSEQVELLRAGDVQRVELVGTAARPEARARMFWQFDRGYYCYLHATGLAAAPRDAVYALWMENEKGEQLLVGSFRPDASGEGEVWAKLPEDAGRAERALVTLEGQPPGQRPLGEVQLRSS